LGGIQRNTISGWNGCDNTIDYDSIVGPIFGEIVNVIVQNNILLFLCSIYETLGCNTHIHGYEISKTHNTCIITIHENLFDPLPIYFHRISNGEMYCILRYCIL